MNRNTLLESMGRRGQRRGYSHGLRPETLGISIDETQLKNTILPRRPGRYNKQWQIDRQNASLLKRLTQISMRGSRTKPSQTLPAKPTPCTRLRQLSRIQQSNLKLTKRLQAPKSYYSVSQMRIDWKRNKQMMKNISEFPLVVLPQRKGRHTAPIEVIDEVQEKSFQGSRKYRLVKSCLVSYFRFRVEIVFTEDGLSITADNPHLQILKVINIEKGEAIAFVREECGNNLENVFARLRFDGENLYLVSGDYEQEENLRQIEEEESQAQLKTINVMKEQLQKSRPESRKKRKSMTCNSRAGSAMRGQSNEIE